MSLELLRSRPNLVWRELHWPSDLPAETAASLLRQLATDQFVRLAVFEVESTAGKIIYRIGVTGPSIDRVTQLFGALVPDGALTGTPFIRDNQSKASANVGKLFSGTASWRVAVSTRHRPLRTDSPEQITRGLLAALTATTERETITLQWLLGPARSPHPVAAKTPSSTVRPWWAPLTGSGEAQLDTEQRNALAAKRSDHAFACLGRVAIKAASLSRSRALAVGVLAGLRIAESPGIKVRLVKEPVERFNQVVVPWRWPSVVNVAELLGLLAWPLGSESLPGVPREESRWLRPDPSVRAHGRVLGVATAPGENRELGLSINDARQHLHVIGPTGAGKSNLLGNLVLADINAGRGVVLIDGKGDLCKDILARMSPNRANDVVVIDPSDLERPVGLNPLLARGRNPELIADQVLAAFHGLYESQWGPRLQVIMHAALLTLAGRGDASLCALPALLTNPAIRRRLLADIDDPVALQPFWAWFESISEPERQQAIAPVLSRLQPLLLRKSLRAIVGQVEPRFHIDDVFTKRRIVLVSLAKGLIGPEAAALLGSLFMAELWQAVLERARIQPERRHPVVIYADEFQDYVHLPTDMGDALAQARGLGVGLTLAHQHLAQLPAGTIRPAVLANARSRVCFQMAADDAQAMARLSGGSLTAEDFQRLRRYEAYVQLVADGEMTGFASIRTLPMPPASADPADIRGLSRNRYGRPVDEVDAEIRRMIEGDPDQTAPPGRRRRSEP